MQKETSNISDRIRLLERIITRLQRRNQDLEQISARYWTARRIIFVTGALLALFFCRLSGTSFGVAVAVAVVIAFALVAFYHRKVQESITRTLLLIDIKRIQVARIRLDWEGIPLIEGHNDSSSETNGRSSPTASHPFRHDLDITGDRSLQRLLDSAVTREGGERLSSWLLNTNPDRSIIEHRQRLVDELKGHSIFRDKLQLLSAVASKDAEWQKKRKSGWAQQWNSRILVDWIERGANAASLLPTIVLLSILAALYLALLVLALLEVIPHVWPIAFLIYASVMIFKQPRIATAWSELQELERALSRFTAVFQYLERRGYRTTPGLERICAPFLDKKRRPSAEMRKLEGLAAALGLRTNALLWLLAHALVPWDFIFTHRLELVRKGLAHLLPRWLDAWYELEALNSLANFAYLNPDYVFPRILDQESQDFTADSLGHPLLKRENKVCNDFQLDQAQKVVILTGSNMAGKSTLLRTVGVNLCLAYAGAPVNASRMQTSLFRIFTCIKVSDSVQDGLSYFYAEVKRLQALLAATEVADPRAVLFLIDEIFRGTNSRERLIGSRSYIRALTERNALGLVATHDLELVKLADEIKGVANFHFREEVHEGKMVFDYKLRPGPCPTTNALHIMRLEGLPVKE